MDFLAARVARRYTTSSRVTARFLEAMEHSSPEALKEYLHEHPNADPKNHSVGKGKGEDKPKAHPADHPGAQKGKMNAAKADMAARKLYESEDKMIKDVKDPKKADAVIAKYKKSFQGAIDELSKAVKNFEAATKDNPKASEKLKSLKKKVQDMSDGKDSEITPKNFSSIRMWNSHLSDVASEVGTFGAEHLHKMYDKS